MEPSPENDTAVIIPVELMSAKVEGVLVTILSVDATPVNPEPFPTKLPEKVVAVATPMTTTPAVQGFRTIPGNVPKVTPMGILTGQQSNITLPPRYADMPISDTGGVYTNVPGGSAYGNVMPGKEISLDADIFSKPEMAEVTKLNEFGLISILNFFNM